MVILSNNLSQADVGILSNNFSQADVGILLPSYAVISSFIYCLSTFFPTSFLIFNILVFFVVLYCNRCNCSIKVTAILSQPLAA